jgi:tripartite-type tricarboxylate transporter receptor subunit TctC
MARAFLVALLFCSAAFGQGFPNKPLRIVVPLVPGGNQDIVARAVAEELAKGLGQQVIVENRPIVGTQFVKGAPADGYTLLSVAVTFARVPGVVKAANYDPRTDFTGVSLVCRIPQLLVVNPGFAAKNVQELVAMAKAKPGEIAYGGSGNGSTGHVAAELFMRATGTKLLQVPYKGNAQAVVDVMGGQIAMMFDQVSTSAGHVKGGKLRALAVTTMTRSPLLPEVPTLNESGLKGFDIGTWFGLLAPAGTPPEIVNRLNAAIVKIVAAKDFREQMAAQALDARSSTPAEFSAHIRAELAKFAKLVREAKIQPE